MTVMNDLVNEMFYTFARFEYALKATGFIKNTDDAKPDWTKFANSISPLFDNHDDPDVKSAVEFIFADPPNKQVVRDGRLEWRNADSGTVNCCDSLLIFVRRIRNNLFHGGKFTGQHLENGDWSKLNERDEELVRHSICILKACLIASPSLQAAYDH